MRCYEFGILQNANNEISTSNVLMAMFSVDLSTQQTDNKENASIKR